jgi:glycosyltransferase involved in cell wall biosynthesis
VTTDSGFPRVLLVSSSVFNSYSGGGVTLTNLFRGWPRDRIAAVHSEVLAPETEVCERYFELGSEEVRLAVPLADAVRNWLRRRAADQDGKAGPAGGPAFVRWTRTLVGDGIPQRVQLSAALARWVEDFRPHLLYTLLGSLGYVRLVQLFHDRFGIPVVIHMMDDWPEHLHRRGVFGPWLRRQLRRELADVVRTAQVRMGICDAMSEEYTGRYGVPFETFHNPVEEAEWRLSAKRNYAAKNPFRIVYYGTIVEVAQLHSLMDVGWAVAGVQAAGETVEFCVHTQPYSLQQCRAVLERCPGITIGPPTGRDDFIPVITGADLLVLPANFDNRSVRYLRLSFPTKLPAYMASGTPILAYGPSDMAQIRYLAEAGTAHVVTERCPNTLKAAIHRLMADQPYRAEIGGRAHRVALEDHGATRVRDAFRRALAGAAEQRLAGAMTTS